MNVAKTARDLYIHRTSLQARIERVEMMLDADLSNPDERLRVSMSLRVLENS
jgi:DNA-binding PucR family transcriptional regulator